AQAHKEETKRIREELNAFKQVVDEIDGNDSDELIARKMRQIQERKERREKRKRDKADGTKNSNTATQTATGSSATEKKPSAQTINVGDSVRIKGLKSVGTVESV
ncbi:endonuclease MutS2, partial [Parabacteroides distasonis]